MSKKQGDLKAELGRLVTQGEMLYLAMARDLGKLGTEDDGLKERNLELPRFATEYDPWYSVAIRVVAQVIPDRLTDFVAQYKNEKRKAVDFLTYTVSDYLLGLKTTRGVQVVVDGAAGLPKMERQLSILKSAQAVFDSSLVGSQARGGFNRRPPRVKRSVRRRCQQWEWHLAGKAWYHPGWRFSHDEGVEEGV